MAPSDHEPSTRGSTGSRRVARARCSGSTATPACCGRSSQRCSVEISRAKNGEKTWKFHSISMVIISWYMELFDEFSCISWFIPRHGRHWLSKNGNNMTYWEAMSPVGRKKASVWVILGRSWLEPRRSHEDHPTSI